MNYSRFLLLLAVVPARRQFPLAALPALTSALSACEGRPQLQIRELQQDALSERISPAPGLLLAPFPVSLLGFSFAVVAPASSRSRANENGIRKPRVSRVKSDPKAQSA